MFHVQGATRQTCNLLAVLSVSNAEYKQNQSVTEDNPKYPFPDIVSSGRLEVQVLKNPSIDEIRKALDSSQANLVYFQGEQLSNGDISALVWDIEAVSGLFQTHLPTTVYLEIPNGEKLAEALHSKGIPYVIYWKNTFTCYTASHFRHTLFSVIQSSSCHTWDAFELAHASFRLYCITNNATLGPLLLGDPPKINVTLPNTVTEDNNNESSSEDLSAIKIYDEDVTIKFLICGASKTLDESLLESLEDGLNALLSIEMRGSKLHNRVSAVPPPLQAGVFSRGVVTMRCDMSTTTSSHISLLVSGNAQTCFDDQLLENHIKREIIEKSKLTHALSNSEENIKPLSEPRRSVSIACGASVFEVSLKIPTWASQILRQLAPDTSYRSLVMLGIASIQGLSVAAFEKNDAERFLFFCKTQGHLRNLHLQVPPIWLKPPVPSKNEGILPPRKKLKSAALKPIPHIHQRKMLPFSSVLEINGVEKHHVPLNTSIKHNTVTSANNITHRKSVSASYQANKQTISLNPLPLKKHGCDRKPIHVCSEDEFLKDVMQFLILRGHNRLIPQGGLAEFPDAILNAKRLDLFNLYREVVSRGGFHVGNGINWKGQVFSKMSNHTVTNRMTGVGNTLKRHYETYLLEYELAHDDVDGECCLLCHSSAAGDWVNCGICGEWAHFGCDRRQGLGAFKDYAKTDGLEYICPQCSVTNFKKKTQKTTNGYS